MTRKNYFIIVFIYSLSFCYLIHCQITGEYDRISSDEPDYIHIKYIPPILHNDNVYITILYKCSSLSQRRISLSVRIERTLYRTNFAVFRRHWFCQNSTNIKIRYVRVQLHRSLAYASDIQSNFQSWPIEHGQLKLIMYNGQQENEDEILRKIEYNVRFLPAHKRPSIHSFRWNPLMKKIHEDICPKEPEVVRIINYPLILTGNVYGKQFVPPPYRDYGLRLEQQMRFTRPKFSIIFWLYIDEYCAPESKAAACAILQHTTFNKSRLTPEIFMTPTGQIKVDMYERLYDLNGYGAQTLTSVPKKDWCRVAFITDEYYWRVFVNCLQTWDKPIIAEHRSLVYYSFYDEFGIFTVGGIDTIPSFRGIISQMDLYRRIAFTYEQLPSKLDASLMPFSPPIIQESNECKSYFHLFKQCQEQSELFNKRFRQKFACSAHPFIMDKSNQQCPLVRTWKQQWSLSTSSNDVRYRIFRALRRQKMNSTRDVSHQLFNLTIKLIESNDLVSSCNRIITWSEQAICYGHPSAHSLLATLHQFGLCGLKPNSTRALELLFAGALLNDRISLLALGHRHFYGLDGVPFDYDAAYVYYQQMAGTSRHELYNPKAGEAAMELIRLTDTKLLEELTFDKSDSFYWLRQQATRGVASAQHRLGSLMYAGRNGLTRNVQAAVEYFRLGAVQHDASSHFGYGLALFSGQGTKQNVTEGIRHIEKAVEQGYLNAQVTLGYHAYEIERNYTKAAQLWQECFDRTYDVNCANNLGVMWTAGRYPPSYTVDHVQAWRYYSYAAMHGQIDSKFVVAYYNARGGHPSVARNPMLAASWSRFVAEESTAVGTIVRQALEAYRNGRGHTSLIFYMQAALAGAEVGYFNAGYLCKEFKDFIDIGSFDCVGKLFDMYLMIHGENRSVDSYALITAAEDYQWKKRNFTKAMKLYVWLFQNGDPQGLYSLAQMEEESDSNSTIPLYVWTTIGVQFDEKTVANRYRRLQSIYQHCRTLKIPRSAESYIPCTLAYLRISTLILIDEQSKFAITIVLISITTFLFLIRI